MKRLTLTLKQQAYCRILCTDSDMNQTKAAIAAGYTLNNADKVSSAMMKLPHIQAEIKRLNRGKAYRTQISADKVLEQWWEIANIDRTDAVNLARVNCRYCNGINHRYQFKHSEFIELDAKRKIKPHGGTGFNEWGNPDPECPECFGHGIERLQSVDTRYLPDQHKRLITGMKNGKNGLELTFRDPDKALESIARHLGMFADKLDINIKVGLADKIAARRAKMKAKADD